MSPKRRVILWVSISVGVVIVALLVVASRIPLSSDTLRKRVVDALESKLDSKVELKTLTLHFSPRLKAVGTGLVVRYHGRTDVPPLFSVDSFAVNASLRGLWRRHVDYVELEGLDIQIPPGMNRAAEDADPTTADTSDPRDQSTDSSASPAEDGQGGDASPSTMAQFAKQVVIDQLAAPNASLTILRADPDKPARVWYLHSLKMQSVGLETPMPFQSYLTNAVPPGEIDISGTFGPWARENPGDTPIRGTFTFENADLGVFKGIAGTLSAEGEIGGVLQRIEVDGQTRTPDFTVNVGGHPVPLETTYHAVVDGTNGNTTLDPVDATFLDTSLQARGGVYEIEGRDGREVRLVVTMERGRLEDVMRLAVNTPKPTMTGQLYLTTDFLIPPGKEDVIEKLQLRGQFAIDGGRFTDAGVQRKVSELSRRARGQTKPPAKPERVESDFKGRFALRHGVLSIPVVTFDVPGAIVEMAGSYAMRAETLDFSGELYMDAKISETVTGFKSLLLKLADPIFRKDGKTVVPLKVGGQRQDPQFGLDMKRVFRRSSAPARPNVRQGAKPAAAQSRKAGERKPEQKPAVAAPFRPTPPQSSSDAATNGAR